jgi:hypothetical protein
MLGVGLVGGGKLTVKVQESTGYLCERLLGGDAVQRYGCLSSFCVFMCLPYYSVLVQDCSHAFPTGTQYLQAGKVYYGMT